MQEDFPVDDEESFELLKEKVFRLLHYSEDKLQKELVKEIVINTSNDNRNSIASIDSRSRPLSRVGEHKFRPEGIQGTAANVEFDTGDTSSDDQVIAIDIEKLEPHREQLDEVFMDKSHAFSTINGDFDVERSASFEVGAVDASEKFQRDKSISDSDTSSNSAKVKEDSGVAKLPTVLDNKMTSKFSSQNRMATLGRIMKNSDSNINSFKHVGSVSRSQLSSQIVRSGKVSSGDTAITHLPLDNVSTQQSCVDKSNRFVKKIQTNSYAAAPHDSLHVGMVGDENGNIVHTSDACIPKDNGNDFLESHDGGIVELNGSDNGHGNGYGHGNGNINGSTTGNPSGGVAPTNIIASDSLKDKGIAASLKRKFRTLMKDNLIDDDW